MPRPTVLIVGCGDVGVRVLKLLGPAWQARVLTTSPDRRGALRALGAWPLVGDLDRPSTLARLGGLSERVLHLAPPASDGESDRRTRSLIHTLMRAGVCRRLVYASTSGVYGDVGGARIDETRTVAPATARARRRVDAEQALRAFGRASGARVTILRVPGIYALDRAGGDPRERLRRGTPVLAEPDDVYTNHIHADDLARACVAALWHGLPQRVVHASDDSELKMGAYFDFAAGLAGLPASPRIARADASAALSPASLSFMSESRRLDNRRLKRELGLVLRYPTVREGLAALAVDTPPPDR